MTSRLSYRIDRVTKEFKRTHPCKVCNGKGKWVVTRTREGQEVPVPEGCPGCGEVDHIILNYVRVEKIER